MNKIIYLSILIIATLTLAACSTSQNGEDDMLVQEDSMSTADESHTDEMMDEDSSDETMDSDSDEGDMMDDDSTDEMEESESASDESMIEDVMVDTPAWFDHEFADARTGQTFSISGFQGKVVLVETMAMWCSNCMRQQRQVIELHELIGEREDFISFGLDIDPNENITVLSGYVDSNGFDWLYSVSPTEVSREIDQLYGSQFLNPPSTPMLIVDRHGEAHPLPFGIKSAADLYNYVLPFLDESM